MKLGDVLKKINNEYREMTSRNNPKSNETRLSSRASFDKQLTHRYFTSLFRQMRHYKPSF